MCMHFANKIPYFLCILPIALTVPEIAQILGKSEKAVFCRVPYEKGMYGAEYPTINALRIRKCRGKESGK